MNITRENREGQVSVIKVTVGESDYNEAVEKKLREYRRKANMPGFRPGMVPMSIINKTYRKSAIAETAYKMASLKLSLSNLAFISCFAFGRSAVLTIIRISLSNIGRISAAISFTI